MKKKLLVALMLCFFLTGCTNLEKTDSLGTSQTEEILQTPTNTDLEHLYNDYFYPVFLSSISASTWNDPTELSPNNFVDYYIATRYYQPGKALERNTEQEDIVSSQELEAFVFNHFDISSDFLKQADSYDPDKDIYVLGYLGGAASSKVVDIARSDDILTLSFEYYSPADEITIIRTGTLNIQIENDGYKYISCTSKEVE